jgi:hypothetical protein
VEKKRGGSGKGLRRMAWVKGGLTYFPRLV